MSEPADSVAAVFATMDQLLDEFTRIERVFAAAHGDGLILVCLREACAVAFDRLCGPHRARMEAAGDLAGLNALRATIEKKVSENLEIFQVDYRKEGAS
jgi:hypothetical protein